MPHARTPFWLVWTEKGALPKFKHPSRFSADKEAMRLAEAIPGQEFYVLEPVASFRKENVIATFYRREEN